MNGMPLKRLSIKRAAPLARNVETKNPIIVTRPSVISNPKPGILTPKIRSTAVMLKYRIYRVTMIGARNKRPFKK
jgi:hypothetical protein